MGFVPPVHLMHSRRNYGSKQYYDSKDVVEVLVNTLQELPNVVIKFENAENLENFLDGYKIDDKRVIVIYKGKEIFNITIDESDSGTTYYYAHHEKDSFSSGNMLTHNHYYYFIEELFDEKIIDKYDEENREIVKALKEIDDLF